ncbi:MAG: endo-1,4-beta-xylanase [Candidatus Pacebacteria bacterium]|nr:endo-1,4-beta-xylanase [Candidatus Paceibacterota bacterium]MDD5357008.1 endo-1,4-beta-xylanase [Candidatus Paceibacterota bacterium]
MRRLLKYLFWIILALVLIFVFLSFRAVPEKITYGVSFSTLHALELGLDWKAVYEAMLQDLQVKNLRLSAYWQDIEPKDGVFDYSNMDFQMSEAKRAGASVIFSVGRRLPVWPECHAPEWEWSLDKETGERKLLEYIEKTVNRYKNYGNITYWQVENEPFFTIYAKEWCKPFDESFLKKEIELVKKLDPAHPVLLTDSGELGTWWGAKRDGDVFGSSLYLYAWNQTFGQFRYPITPAYYRIRQNIADLVFGKKKNILSELSLEPWLLTPIKDAPIDLQLSRMDIAKFNSIITFAKTTSFGEQYLWGVEWWYYMKQNGHPEFWDAAKVIFK